MEWRRPPTLEKTARNQAAGRLVFYMEANGSGVSEK